MKPSDLVYRTPFDSVFQNCECETVARNIIAILNDTGDEWREIEWDEYETRRLQDGGFSSRELTLFNKVIGYCVSEQTARLFSPNWNV